MRVKRYSCISCYRWENRCVIRTVSVPRHIGGLSMLIALKPEWFILFYMMEIIIKVFIRYLYAGWPSSSLLYGNIWWINTGNGGQSDEFSRYGSIHSWFLQGSGWLLIYPLWCINSAVINAILSVFRILKYFRIKE